MTKALVIRAAGTNCDAEMMRAFTLAGARASLVHIDRLVAEPARVQEFDILAFPGGFSFGDDIASGRIFAARLREKLYPALRDAARAGVPMIGACNGFQVMVQVGLLPGPAVGEPWPDEQAPKQAASLSFNSGGRFIDAWVPIEINDRSPCIWTKGLSQAFKGREHDVMRLPIAHGEGRFVAASDSALAELERHQQVAVRYATDVNGSTNNIAGVCDTTGRIFALMPHPERYLDWVLHPFATRLSPDAQRGPTPGLMMFQNAVRVAAGVAV
jgi:phosphoribosylformylglycinamidine synthase subunit PurQ / glutaminase